MSNSIDDVIGIVIGHDIGIVIDMHLIPATKNAAYNEASRGDPSYASASMACRCLRMNDRNEWQKWVNSRDRDSLQWAIGYLEKHARLLFDRKEWLVRKDLTIDELRSGILATIQNPHCLHSGWIQRVNNAWRQAQYRKAVTSKKKVISYFILPKEKKKQLKDLAKIQGLTTHTLLEKLIEQATANTKKERPSSPEEQLHRVGEGNRVALEGMAPAPHIAQPDIQSILPLNPPRTSGRYDDIPSVQGMDVSPESIEQQRLTEVQLTDESSEAASPVSAAPTIKRVRIKRRHYTTFTALE